MANPPFHLSITAFCQACGSKHAFDPSVVGRKARCLKCGHTFVVPALATPAAPAPAPKSPDPAPKPPSNNRPTSPEEREVPASQPSPLPIKSTSPDVEVIMESGSNAREPVRPAPARDEDRSGAMDPLHELAHAEAAPRRRVQSKEVGVNPPPVEVVHQPAVDPRAALTAMGVMQGMFYLAIIAVIIVALEMRIGLGLAAWILLPIAVVYGKKIVMRILFLLTGRAAKG